MDNKVIIIVIVAVVLIIASFFVGYYVSPKNNISDNSNIQNQINQLQNQKDQINNQIQELEKQIDNNSVTTKSKCGNGICEEGEATIQDCSECDTSPSAQGCSCKTIIGSCPQDCVDTKEIACGNNICEEGEASYLSCPECHTDPCPMSPCERIQGTCPQDCVDTYESCLEEGGEWGIFSYMIPYPKESCNLPTSDGGKVCSSSSECETFCQAPEGSKEGDEVNGTCYGWQKGPSCWISVYQGIVGPEACA